MIGKNFFSKSGDLDDFLPNNPHMKRSNKDGT